MQHYMYRARMDKDTGLYQAVIVRPLDGAELTSGKIAYREFDRAIRYAKDILKSKMEQLPNKPRIKSDLPAKAWRSGGPS